MSDAVVSDNEATREPLPARSRPASPASDVPTKDRRCPGPARRRTLHEAQRPDQV